MVRETQEIAGNLCRAAFLPLVANKNLLPSGNETESTLRKHFLPCAVLHTCYFTPVLLVGGSGKAPDLPSLSKAAVVSHISPVLGASLEVGFIEAWCTGCYSLLGRI